MIISKLGSRSASIGIKNKKVMIFGTFDILHKGHENFFKQARKHGNYLIAVVARDKTVLVVKGKLPRNSEKTRLKNLKKIKLIDKVISGNIKDKYTAIKKLKPNIICLGYDQKAFTNKLKNLGIKIVKLKPYKPGIYKSSKINNFFPY